MSKLTEFYAGAGKDHAGRKLAEVQAFSFDQLEDVHDYIQWLFPLPEPSQYNPWAPLLTDADIQAFNSDTQLQLNLRKSFNKALDFYGLVLAHGAVLPGAHFHQRRTGWQTPYNHNLLRITRILRSLTLLGLKTEALAFLVLLEDQYRKRQDTIGAETIGYWRKAVK